MLCTPEQLERYLSPLGVMLFSDHEYDGVADSAVISDCIGRATSELLGLLTPLYLHSELDQSSLVSEWCVVLSCYYLCIRRGNPPPDSLAREFDRIMDKEGFVYRARKGSFIIPGIKRTSVNAPAITNYQVDRRWANRTVRVVRVTSSAIDSELPRDFSHRRWY